MKGKLAAANITQIINELKKISSLNKIKKDKYISKLEELHKLYINIEIDEKFKIQYNRMNAKGKEVIKELKSLKKPFAVVLNTKHPNSEDTKFLRKETVEVEKAFRQSPFFCQKIQDLVDGKICL